MIRTIAARELRSLFFSPLAWTMLAVVQVIVAYLFLAQVDFFLQIQPRLPQMPGAPGLTEIVVAPTFGNAALILLLVVPMLTMRLVSDELRNQTLSLLFSAPVSMSEIILGKYCGVLGYLLIQLLLIALLPCALLLGGALDFGIFASGLLGLFLLLAGFAAVGLFMSTLTAQPVIAAISTFGVLLLLWIIDWSGAAGGKGASVFGYLSMLRHYESLLKGVFNSADVAYYLLLIALFVILSIRRLDSYRLQH